MSIKEDTTFPIMTQVNRLNSSPITVDGTILVTFTATTPKTVQDIQAACLYLLTCPEAKPQPQLLH